MSCFIYCYVECHYVECHNAECLVSFIVMLSVIMLNVIRYLSVTIKFKMLNACTLSVAMLNVIMLSVVAPFLWSIQLKTRSAFSANIGSAKRGQWKT